MGRTKQERKEHVKIETEKLTVTFRHEYEMKRAYGVTVKTAIKEALAITNRVISSWVSSKPQEKTLILRCKTELQDNLTEIISEVEKKAKGKK